MVEGLQTTYIKLGNIQEYRFGRVIFGIISSSCPLGATIECFGSELAMEIKNDIF